MFSEKKYKEMICPICGNFEFTALQEGDETPPWCYSCGWIYDFDQIENPKLKNGENQQSLEEYKLWYKNIIENNPEYFFSTEDPTSPNPHSCPICGKYNFDDDDSHDICPYCGWEDDELQFEDPNYSGGANSLSFNEYKKVYNEKITTNPKYKWKSNK